MRGGGGCIGAVSWRQVGGGGCCDGWVIGGGLFVAGGGCRCDDCGVVVCPGWGWGQVHRLNRGRVSDSGHWWLN